MKIFGTAPPSLIEELDQIFEHQGSLPVKRNAPARSSVAHPQSTDLEGVLAPDLLRRGFQHHVKMKHPRTGVGFEYDFWRPKDGVAIEVMGYRADDEIYKDILKFHVHDGTKIGVVFVPRYKWIASRRTDTNYAATIKALAFADSYMKLDALIALPYDWDEETPTGDWRFIKPTSD